MKIHVVQQGDTLWNIAKKYGVDFEQLKQINSHLANPDQLTPGMKVKIPQNPVQPKKPQAGGSGTGKEQPTPKEQGKEAKTKPEKKLPKKEEPVKPIEGKEEAPKKEDHELLKVLIKSCAPYVLYKLLKEEKPEVINQIKIEVGLENTSKMEQSVQMGPMPYLPYHKPAPPVPAPPPKKELAPIKKPAPPTAPYASGCSEKGWQMAPPPKPKQEWAPYPAQPHWPGGHQGGYGYGKNMYQPWSMTPCGPQPMPYQGQMYGPVYAPPPNFALPYGSYPHSPVGTHHPSTWGTGAHHIPSPGIHQRLDGQAELGDQPDSGKETE